MNPGNGTNMPRHALATSRRSGPRTRTADVTDVRALVGRSWIAAVVAAAMLPLPARAGESGGGTAAGHAAVRAFAREHHPELAALLEQLETADPAAFAAASAEIGRTRERLERLRERQPDLHEAKLEEWKLSSRIRLVLARMALTKDPDPQLDAELRELVRQRQVRQRVVYLAEREKIAKRLERIEDILTEQDRDPAVAVDRETAELVRRSTRRK